MVEDETCGEECLTEGKFLAKAEFVAGAEIVAGAKFFG